MARTPRKIEAVDVTEKSVDEEKFAGALALHRAEESATAVARLEQATRVTALAQQLNYTGSVDPAVLENSAQDAIRRIGMAVFELGGYLLMLREASPHGAFLPTLERLNLAPQAAQRYMQVTRRFANTASMRHLESAGIAKLIELVVLDDEQIEELAELGQTGELALDDVASMSVKQLRAAVREVRAERAADKQLLEAKNAKIDKLQREKQLIARMDADEVFAQLQKEATTVLNEVRGLVGGSLRQALIAIRNHGDQDNTALMAGLVGQVQADLRALRDEFNLPEVGGTPEWQQWAEAQGIDATPGAH